MGETDSNFSIRKIYVGVSERIKFTRCEQGLSLYPTN